MRQRIERSIMEGRVGFKIECDPSGKGDMMFSFQDKHQVVDAERHYLKPVYEAVAQIAIDEMKKSPGNHQPVIQRLRSRGLHIEMEMEVEGVRGRYGEYLERLVITFQKKKGKKM